MVITNTFQKLEADYNESNSNYIEYEAFQHAGSQIRPIYTRPDGYTYVLFLYITYNDHIILSPFYIKKEKEGAELTPFFDPAIYKILKPIIIHDNNSTIPLFDDVCTHIITADKNEMNDNDYINLRNTRNVRERDPQNGEIYFNHLRSSKISKDMASRLYRMYPKNKAGILLRVLRLLKKTPVFVSDKERYRDLIILLKDEVSEDERILLLQ